MSALGHERTFAVQNVMSALPSKADMCGATKDVRYVPIADIAPPHSIISSARACIDGGTPMPSALAVLRLMYQLNFSCLLYRRNRRACRPSESSRC